MDPCTSAAAEQTPAARDEELRGECAKAFAHYKKGDVMRGTELLQKLLARHPAHPLLNYAYARLAHMLYLAQRQSAGAVTLFDECRHRAFAALQANPNSLHPYLFLVQILCDYPVANDEALDTLLDTVRAVATPAATRPFTSADFEYAKAIATFDTGALQFLPDVRECADSAAYRCEALACLTKALAKINDLLREAESLAKNNPGQSLLAHFVSLRDTEHAADAARRLLRAQVRAPQEEAARALAAVHQVMAGEGTAHDLQEAAVGWRESADQGDASGQLLIGALYGRGGGGVKRNVQLGKRYLELSAAAGNEAAVALLKELRKCVACGELDVHHMICPLCRDVRYCDRECQLLHWRCPTHPHKPRCVPRRESAGAGAGAGAGVGAEAGAGAGAGAGVGAGASGEPSGLTAPAPPVPVVTVGRCRLTPSNPC